MLIYFKNKHSTDEIDKTVLPILLLITFESGFLLMKISTRSLKKKKTKKEVRKLLRLVFDW